MAQHDYTPREALELLMRLLQERSPALAAEVQRAIRSGLDIVEEDPQTAFQKKPRSYRRTVAYSDEQALNVAIDVLNAHFVEQPTFLDSTFENMRQAAIGFAERSTLRSGFDSFDSETIGLQSLNEPKAVEIEIATTTQILRDGEELLELQPPTAEAIETQRQNIESLRRLVTFSET